MSTDDLMSKLRTLASPFEADDSKEPVQALLDLVDETVLQRRICVSFGVGGVSAELLVRSRRLVRIEALRGLDLPGDLATLLSTSLSAGDEDKLSRLGDLFRTCLERGGQPYFMGAESTTGQHDIMNKGISVARLGEVLRVEDDTAIAKPA